MKKNIFLSVICTVFFISCQKNQVIFREQNDETLLYETSCFSCYSISSTKSDFPYYNKIILKECPDIEILFGDNSATKENNSDYRYKSLIISDNQKALTIYSDFETQNNGYLLTYYIEGKGAFEYFIPFETKSPGWGKRTMTCLEDVYANHGFLSVWVVVQTAFIPQTAVAFAAACAARNL